MNLPKVIANLVKAQDNFDSVAYADCFEENAVVHDEGHVYTGRAAINEWIKKANENYKTVMSPLAYTETTAGGMLKAEVSGDFEGSPAVLYYHIELSNDRIQSLKITG